MQTLSSRIPALLFRLLAHCKLLQTLLEGLGVVV